MWSTVKSREQSVGAAGAAVLSVTSGTEEYSRQPSDLKRRFWYARKCANQIKSYAGLRIDSRAGLVGLTLAKVWSWGLESSCTDLSQGLKLRSESSCLPVWDLGWNHIDRIDKIMSHSLREEETDKHKGFYHPMIASRCLTKDAKSRGLVMRSAGCSRVSIGRISIKPDWPTPKSGDISDWCA